MTDLIFGPKKPRLLQPGMRKRPTSTSVKRWLLGVVFVLVISPLLSTVYTYTRGGEGARVHAATSSTLNFSARLLNASGALVADGSYSVEFKLYDAVSGGTNEWTETQTVVLKNGYLSANLGSVTPFSGTIDWSQEKWLTMNVNSDGEMTPRIKLTGVPFAFRAGLADKLSITGGTLLGDDILQKAPASVQSISSADSGLRFNQTGAGGLIQLQGNGLDVFTVSKAGDISGAGNLSILGGLGTFGTASQAGSLALFDGSSNTGTLSTTALGSNRAYTLPDASGTVCLENSVSCGFVMAGGLGAAFINGGNAFGTDGTLGTTDNFNLRFITNNTEKFTILANGNVGVGDTTPAALFTVGTSDALQIDASGNLSTAGTITSGLINGQAISSTANFTGSLTAAGLITANGGVTLGSTQALTINSEAFTDLTGNGLGISSGALQVLYGSTANTAVQGNTQITVAAGTGLSGGGAFTLGSGGTQTLNLANTAVTLGSYGSQSSVATFTVDAQGRLTAAGNTAIGNLANGALQNSSIGLNYGTNLSGDASVALGGTLNVNFSATPSFTTVTTSGAINGQTISSAASLTGTLNLAGLFTANGGATIIGVTNVNTTGTSVTTIGNSGAAITLNGATTVNNSLSVSGTNTLTVGTGATTLGGTLTVAGTTNLNGTTNLATSNATTQTALAVAANSLSTGSGLSVTTTSTALVSGNLANISQNTNYTENTSISNQLLNVSRTTNATGGAASITKGNTTTGYNTSSISGGTPNLTISHTIASNSSRILLVAISHKYDTITATYNGMSLTKYGSSHATTDSDSPGNNGFISFYYLLSPSIGTANIVITSGTNGAQYYGAVATDWYNVNQTTPFATLQFNSSNSDGFTNLTVNADEVAVDVLATDAWGSYSVGSGQTLLSQYFAGPFGIGSSYKVGAHTQMAWTFPPFNGQFWGHGAIVLKPASGAGTITNTGSLVNFANNCLAVCVDSSNVLTLNQQVASATGTVLNILNSGTGLGLAVQGGASINGGLNLNSSAISGVTTLGLSGAITGATTVNTINGLIINSGALSGISTINMSGGITAATTNTINGLNINAGNVSGLTGMTFTSGGIDLNNGGITNAGAISGATTLNAASNKFNVGANGGLTSAFTALNGSTTATSGSGITPGTINVGSGNTANFDVGNYVLVNGTYAKITSKTASALSITPSLSWSTGAAVTEYYIPEIGGDNTTSTLTNRYGRGYFIAGVATGNGTTYYNEDSIDTSLASFDLLNTNVATLNFAGAATTLNIGSSGTTVNILGDLATSGGQTITAGGGLVVSSGGANITGGISNNGGGITSAGTITGLTGLTFTSGSLNLNSGGITNAGSLAGVTTLSASGAITAATTTNTINGLVINSGALTGVTGITFTSGALNLNSGGITNAGALSGVTSLSTSGALTLNSFSGVAGLLKVNGSGTVSVATAGTDFERALTFNNGLTRTVDTIGLGGTLGGNTTVDLSTFNLNFNNGGTFIVGGTSSPLSTKMSVIGSIGAVSTGYNVFAANASLNAYGYIRSVDVSDTDSRLEFGAYDINGVSGGRSLVLNQLGGNVGIGGDLTPDGLFSVGSTSQFQVSATGTITAATATNTINGLVINTGSLSGITGFSQSSGNFAISGSGTFGTGTGAISLNGATTVTGTNTLTVNGGLTSLNAGLTALGTVHFGGVADYAEFTSTGDVQLFGTADLLVGNDRYAFRYAPDQNYGLIFSGTAGAYQFTGGAGTPLLSISAATGALTGATTVNTINGLIINAGALSGITTISASSTITANTTGTINGLNISSGSLSGITGFSQGSGNFAITGTGTFSTGTGAISLNGALTAVGPSTLNGGVTIQTGDTLTFNGQGFTDFTGNGLTLSGTALTVDATTAGTVAGTGSNSGLVVAADGVSLLRGCANNQILKWSTTGPQWNCAADNSGLSDARLKKNIEAVDMSTLSRIRDVKLYSFDYDCTNPAFQTMHCDTDHQQAGVMAQELMQLFPELVIDVNGHYEVRYDALGLYNLKAVGELADVVDALAANNVQPNQVVTNGMLRMDSNGVLQNINGLTMNSGGASIVGGLNNNNGGITSVGSLSGVTGITAQTISLNATGSDNLLSLTKDGNGVFTVFNTGALQLQLDSTNALAVKSANGDNVLNVDTLTGRVRIGSGNSSKTVLFMVDTKSTAGDPEGGTNGAQYYNSDADKFRCYQGNEWQDCVQTAYSEYTVMSTPGPWAQPSSDTEFPLQNRTWIELRNANYFRILSNLTVAGAPNATCRIQYATNTNSSNPDWHDLSSASDGGAIHINGTGPLKSGWSPVAKEGKQESLVRVMCKDGDSQIAPNFTSIRIQVR